MLKFAFTLAVFLLVQAAQAQTSSMQQTPTGSPQAPAERGAGASRPSGMPPLTQEQRGTLRDGRYVNDFFHFQINLSKDWKAVSHESIAADAEWARNYGLHPGRFPTTYLAFYVEDSAVRNVVLSIIPVPPDLPKDQDILTAGMKRIALAQLAGSENPRDYREDLFLGVPSHIFSGFRVAASVQGIQTVESVQLMLRDGFLVMFMVSARSDQDVSDMLRSLNAGLSWTPVTPKPGT